MNIPMDAPEHEFELRAAADERLFDAALAEVLTGEPDTSPMIGEAAPTRQPSSGRRWLTAATMLLAITIAIAVAWQRSTAQLDEAGQDPRPLPTTVMIEGGQALRALPADTASVICQESLPDDLAVLARLQGLRSLSMNAHFEDGGERAWRSASPALLEPLTELAELESLCLPFPMPLSAEHLAVLTRCPKLRSLRIAGDVMQLDAETVRVLARWPALRHLEFLGMPVTPQGVARLAALPRLERVEFRRCRGFDREGFLELMRLPHLVELRLIGIGETTQPLPGQMAESYWGPTPDDLRQLDRLPLLRRLSLSGPDIAPAAIDALPAGLEELSLKFTEVLAPASLQRLKRMAGLRVLCIGVPSDLTESQRIAVDDAAADLIATLPLTKAEWSGPLGPALARALATAPAIGELALTWYPEADFGPLAKMPRLTQLTLHDRWSPNGPRGAGPVALATARPSIEAGTKALRPLRDCRSLQRVVLHCDRWPDDLITALREALGPAIEFVLR